MNKNLTKIVSKLMILVSLALAGVSAAKVIDFSINSKDVSEQIEKAEKTFKQDEKSTKEFLAAYQDTAKKLKEKSLFAPPKKSKKTNPVKSVNAILGAETQVNGGDKWYKVGDKIGDAEITAIEATQIKVEWDGKESSFAPIEALKQKEAPQKSRPKPKTSHRKRVNRSPEPDEARPEPVAAEKPEVSANDPLDWIEAEMSDRLKEKLLEKWNEASDEEKERMKKGWESMPEERKQQAIDHMEQNIDKI